MGRTSDAKEKLLDVAFRLIWDSSYGGVSVDQICAQADVNKGSFYHFFGSKSDLAIAAYEEHWKQRQPELDRIFSAQSPPLERLTRWCESAYDRQKERAKKFGHVCGCPYASIGVEVATQDDKIRAKAEELIARGTKYVETAIAEAQREGSLPAGDARQLAQQAYSFVLGALLRAKIQNDVEVLRDLSPTVMAIIGAKRVEAVAA
jgi:TetR/AcrR family transcriptional regulator, transcriptional repressor for nem operon